MAATSTMGVGLGAADSQKGPAHLSIGSEKIVGPRVVVADDATLSVSGTKTIILPHLGGSASDYIVNVTDADATAAAACAASLTMDSTSTTVSLKGPNSSVVYYAIIKKGLAI